MLIIPNITQSKTYIIAPNEHEIAKLKNNGKKLESKLVTKYVSATVGNEIKLNFIIGLNKFSFKFVFFFIMRIFNKDVTETQIPIPKIKARIPIYFGKNIIQININIEPTI